MARDDDAPATRNRSPWLAATASTDVKVLARGIARTREHVREGRTLASRDIRGVIERSWRRCDAARFAAPQASPTDPGLDERLARWPFDLVRPVLDRLTEALDPEDGQILIVTDADAVILMLDGTPAARAAAARCGASLGTQWSEDRVGTNGMGTALAEDHAVQILGPEHLCPFADPWVCSAAVVHDPETGEPLGTVDISGAVSGAHPHTLSLVKLAALNIQAVLADEAAKCRARLDARAGDHVRGGRARAVVRPNGTVVVAADPRLVGIRIQPLRADGCTVLLAGRQHHAEPVEGGFVLWPAEGDLPMRGSLRLATLGRESAVLTLDGRDVVLSRRRSDIMLLLALRPYGLTDEQLAFELYGEVGRAVTARAEISRLRRDLGPLVTTTPYRLRGRPSTDFDDIEGLVRRGDLRAALDLYVGSVLPRSEVPAISECREALEYMLREGIHASGDIDLLARWIEHPCGVEDLDACRVLVDLLDPADPRSALAACRLQRQSG